LSETVNLPHTRAQLFTTPIVASVMVGFLAGLFAAPLIGAQAAWIYGVGATIVTAAFLAWGCWRSDYGPRHWRLAAVFLAFLLAMTAPLVGSIVATVTRDVGWGRGVTVLLWAGLGVTAGVSAELERRRLHGSSRAWWSTVAHADSRRVGDLFPSPPLTELRWVWLVPAAVFNAPVVYVAANTSEGSRAFSLFGLVVGAALIYAAARGLGPLIARAHAGLDAEQRAGHRFRHRSIDHLNALRGGKALLFEPKRPRGNPWVRRLRGLLQVIALLGAIGVVTLGVFEVSPAWQQLRLWSDYRPAYLVVYLLGVTTKHADWTGRGEVNEQDVSFRRHELRALLGPVPSASDEALAMQRQRLPLRAQVLWNPEAERRLLAADVKREPFAARAEFALNFLLVCLFAGAAAFGLDQLLRAMTDANGLKARRLARKAQRDQPRAAGRDGRRKRQR
jgi:hypothetical protein